MTRMLLALWKEFLQIGLLGIGGGYAVLPLIQERIVQMQGWLEAGEFTDIITISQMTPGPLAVNASTFTGIRLAGIGGAVVSTFGCVLPGIMISLFLEAFFRKQGKAGTAEVILQGLKAASIGLILSAAVTILKLAFWEQGAAFSITALRPAAVLIFAGAFFLLKRKLSPVLVMLAAGLAGFLIYR